MLVQPVGGRGRPSKAVWETRCTRWNGPGRTACRRQDAQALGRLACASRDGAGDPSGVVPDSSATGFQGPLDSR